MQQPQSIAVEDLIPENDLMAIAATLHNLTLKSKKVLGGWLTEPAFKFELNPELLRVLRVAGFTWGPDPKRPDNGYVYLGGHSDQRGADEIDSDIWAFWEGEKNPRLVVSFELLTTEPVKGIIAHPYLGGNWKGGASHQPTIDRLVRALGAYCLDAHPLMKAMVDIDGHPIIKWSDLGFDGMRSLDEFFREQYEPSDLIYCGIARFRYSPFTPNPLNDRAMKKVRYFVPAGLQHSLIDQWKAQLAAFRDKLQ